MCSSPLSLSCSFHTLITYCSRDFSAADQLTPSLVNTKYIVGGEQVAVKICLSLSLLALADQLFLSRRLPTTIWCGILPVVVEKAAFHFRFFPAPDLPWRILSLLLFTSFVSLRLLTDGGCCQRGSALGTCENISSPCSVLERGSGILHSRFVGESLRAALTARSTTHTWRPHRHGRPP